MNKIYFGELRKGDLKGKSAWQFISMSVLKTFQTMIHIFLLLLTLFNGKISMTENWPWNSYPHHTTRCLHCRSIQRHISQSQRGPLQLPEEQNQSTHQVVCPLLRVIQGMQCAVFLKSSELFFNYCFCHIHSFHPCLSPSHNEVLSLYSFASWHLFCLPVKFRCIFPLLLASWHPFCLPVTFRCIFFLTFC